MDETTFFTNLPELVSLATRFGPFLFALLFTIYLTRWAYKKYQIAISQNDPPLKKEDLKTHRIYFLGIASFGCVLVIVSVIWWLSAQASYHVFSGVIENLQEHQKITSDELYFKSSILDIDDDSLQYRKEYFLFVQDEPFKENQKFTIWHSRGFGHPDRFDLFYKENDNQNYAIEFDDSAGVNTLKQIAMGPHIGLSFINSAFAMQPSQPYLEQQSYQTDPGFIIETLQLERSDVGAKIEALRNLQEMDDPQFREMVSSSTDKEPMLLTLFDLSRHTDRELAFFAKKILARFGAEDYLAAQIQGDIDQFHIAEKILLRIEKELALQIISATPEHAINQRIIDLEAVVASGERTRILIPTGSREGDRYYVQAEWNPENTEVLNNLTNLFFHSLRHGRTFEQELEMMRGNDGNRSSRSVYGYTKEWALEMYNAIEEAGGRASFVTGYQRKE